MFSAGAALALGAIYAVRSLLVLRKPAGLELLWRIVLPMAAVFAVCFGLLEVLRGKDEAQKIREEMHYEK